MKRVPLRFGARFLLTLTMLGLSSAGVLAQNNSRRLQYPTSGDPVPKLLLIRIVRAEDERRWDDDLRNLFSARNANVRSRAALAAGRIGDERAIGDLARLLKRDDESDVREMAAFALGEIESPLGADALVAVVGNRNSPARTRAVEALGKITAALPKEQTEGARKLGAVILGALQFEARRRSRSDSAMILTGLTAVLRAKPEGAGPVVAEFLGYSDPRIRADAGNTLARLKLNDGNTELRKLVRSDPDPVVRANAARVLGATEDQTSFTELLDRALKDVDSRVRVSAIRSLGLLKNPNALGPLFQRARSLTRPAGSPTRTEDNEILELATTLGKLAQGTTNPQLGAWLKTTGETFGHMAPEVEIALARVWPAALVIGAGTPVVKRAAVESILLNWRAASGLAQGFGEIAAAPDATEAEATKAHELYKHRAQEILRAMLDYRNSGIVINTLVAVHSEYAIPDVLRAYAAFKPTDLDDVLRRHLKESDVLVRATAAELLGELPSDSNNTKALAEALQVALRDQQLNDAALAIIDALGKQKSPNANRAIMSALASRDHLIRRRAVASLKAAGAGDFSSRIGRVQSQNTSADYERAVSRVGTVRAVVETSRGSFTIELLPAAAPLNVDNFIQLARRNYFNGITFHRVVPNFVIQGGDPRADGNGGPGYSIRCEINEETYERGAVGMALSGKDTGGSQWFVTHAPQPHLDGGYTVFGRVISGMEIVDKIVRGDVIQSITIMETTRNGPRGRANRFRLKP